jgi:hypothetical protein
VSGRTYPSTSALTKNAFSHSLGGKSPSLSAKAVCGNYFLSARRAPHSFDRIGKSPNSGRVSRAAARLLGGRDTASPPPEILSEGPHNARTMLDDIDHIRLIYQLK